MKKKLLSIIVLAALLLQMIVGTVMAQDANNGSLTVETKTVPLGTKEVSLHVTLAENPGISNMRLAFTYSYLGWPGCRYQQRCSGDSDL